MWASLALSVSINSSETCYSPIVARSLWRISVSSVYLQPWPFRNRDWKSLTAESCSSYSWNSTFISSSMYCIGLSASNFYYLSEADLMNLSGSVMMLKFNAFARRFSRTAFSSFTSTLALIWHHLLWCHYTQSLQYIFYRSHRHGTDCRLPYPSSVPSIICICHSSPSIWSSIS